MTKNNIDQGFNTSNKFISILCDNFVIDIQVQFKCFYGEILKLKNNGKFEKVFENLKTLIEDGLIDNSEKLGKIFHKKLNEIKDRYPEYLKYVFGEGLIAGLVFIDKNGNLLIDLCDAIAEKAFQRGLLVVHTGRESIKLAPPLNITDEALYEGIEVLEECIRESIW